VNHLRRISLLVPIALLAGALAFAPGSASAATSFSIKQASYKIKLSGTQLTNWSYGHVQPHLDCTTTYSGKGSQRYDFASRWTGATVRLINGHASIEQFSDALDVIKQIEGSARYVNSGPPHCPGTTFSVETSGCGTRRVTGSFGLMFKGRGRLQASLADDSVYVQCPSASSGNTDGAGGHSLEMADGHVNLSSLLKGRSKAVHAEKTINRDIKYGTTKIGQETTTVQWTLHLRRLGR
jgi:hypothetical protein